MSMLKHGLSDLKIPRKRDSFKQVTLEPDSSDDIENEKEKNSNSFFTGVERVSSETNMFEFENNRQMD